MVTYLSDVYNNNAYFSYNELSSIRISEYIILEGEGNDIDSINISLNYATFAIIAESPIF